MTQKTKKVKKTNLYIGGTEMKTEKKKKKLDVTISEMLEDIATKICDDYCKWPSICQNESDLHKICAECPLNRL